MPTKDEVMQAIHPVEDPELHISIVELGLIYGVDIKDDGIVDVNMTLTSPACPVGPQLKSAVEMSVARLPGVKKVNVNWIWIPPWDPQKNCSEDAKVILGIY